MSSVHGKNLSREEFYSSPTWAPSLAVMGLGVLTFPSQCLMLCWAWGPRVTCGLLLGCRVGVVFRDKLLIMATHSSILAWRIPWTEEPIGLQSRGLQRVRHNWVTEHIHTEIYWIKQNVLSKLISPIFAFKKMSTGKSYISYEPCLSSDRAVLSVQLTLC